MNKISPRAENANVQGIITMNTSGTIVSVTKEISEIFGYNEQNLVNTNINKIIPLDVNGSFATFIKDVLITDITNRAFAIKNIAGVRKDASALKVDILIGKFDVNHTCYLTCFVILDESMVSSNESSEQCWESRQDCKTSSTFSELIHEISQPLSVMSNYTQACLNLIQNENPDLNKLRDFLNRANQQALKLGKIIHYIGKCTYSIF